jgi:hypothetical protein
MTKPRAKNETHIIEQIAKDVLGIETLETRNSDSLDFYDLAVWRIAEALALAYQAGIEKGRSER